jgi:hypothetical protein
MPLAVPELSSALWAVAYLALMVGLMTAVDALRARTSF